MRQEMLLAALCGPLLALVALILTLGIVEGWEVREREGGVLMMLMIPGAVVLSMSILLECRAVQRLPEVAAADVRTILSTTTIGSLGLLALWATEQAHSSNQNDAGGIVAFICLPTLLICASFLWYAARAIRRMFFRAVLLCGFVVAIVITEWRCQSGLRDIALDRLFMFHSLLVAMAVAVALCVWSRRTFSAPEQRKSHE